MCKKLCLAVGAVIVGLLVISFTSLGTLAKVKFSEMTNWADRQVPPETQLKQVRLEMTKIDKDIERHVDKLGDQMTDVKATQEQVASLKKDQTQRKEEIAAMTKALDSSNEAVSYNGSTYSQTAMVRKLDQAVSSYERVKAELKAKERVLAQKMETFEVSKQRVKAMQEQKHELEVAVAELEARIETLKVKQVNRPIEVDDSQVNKCNVLLEKVRNRVNQEENRQQMRDEFGINKPVTATEVRDSKTKADVQQAAKKALQDEEETKTTVEK